MVNPGQVVKPSFIEMIKESMHPEAIAHKIGIEKNVLIDIGLYGTIGFILGFLIKKYSEYFIAIALVIVGLVLLQQFDYISLSVNTAKIEALLGMQTVPGDTYGGFLWTWISLNVVGASSFAVGFLLGLKIG